MVLRICDKETWKKNLKTYIKFFNQIIILFGTMIKKTKIISTRESKSCYFDLSKDFDFPKYSDNDNTKTKIDFITGKINFKRNK